MARSGRGFPAKSLIQRRKFLKLSPSIIHTTDASLKLSRVSHSTDSYKHSAADYSTGTLTSLPTNTNDLVYTFTPTDYTTVSADDGTYVGNSSISANNNIFLFKMENRDSSSNINVTWNGKSTVGGATKTITLQIYNYNSGSWETLSSNTSVAANTDFSLTGSQSTSLANYYSSNIVALRVYQ